MAMSTIFDIVHVCFFVCIVWSAKTKSTASFSDSDHPRRQQSHWQCDIPSAFWCDDAETAKKCGVFDQCMRDWSRKAEPVNVAVYIESLCPDCQWFIAEQLFPAYHYISDIMNLILVPYGNAQEIKAGNKWLFTCQHGPDECVGNAIETCAITFMSNVTEHFTFIHCMEVSNLKPVDAAKLCAKKMPQVPIEDIMFCHNSSLGNQMEHKMAVRTESLVPKHTYVPWVTVNGVHTEAIQQLAERDLIKLVCMTYKGVKPRICSITDGTPYP